MNIFQEAEYFDELPNLSLEALTTGFGIGS
jgi:hypothetical protein